MLTVTLLLALSSPLVQIHLQGEFLDPPDLIERVVRAEVGNQYVPEPAPTPEGAPPAEGLPPGTQSRLGATLRTLGYESAFKAEPAPGGISLTIILHPVQRIRQVRVKPEFGRFPLYEEDILRLIRFRPGDKLPPPSELEADIAESKSRISQYLERQGFYDGASEILVKPTSHPEEVELHVVLYKGRGYQLEDGFPKVIFDASSDKNAIPVSEIQGVFRHFWGRLSCLWLCGEFSSERLREDVQTLLERYHDRGYPGARVTTEFSPDRDLDHLAKRARFIVRIATRKKVEVGFRGNHHISDDDLQKQLTFNASGSYDSYECQNSARAVHHAYQKEGYYEAQVNWTREEPGPNLVRVIFMIEEGPELKIRGIEFAGATGFSPTELQAQIESRVFPTIGAIGLGEGGYLTNTQLKQDEQRLVDFYHKHGYPDVQVSSEVATNPNELGAAGATAAQVAALGTRTEGDLYVRFDIEEGPLVRVAGLDVEYKGEHRTQPQDALRRVRMRVGQPLSSEAAKVDLQAIRRWLRSSGFRDGEVELELRDDPAGKRVVFKINEGRPMRFGETLLRGNFRTLSRVIRRELPWNAGGPYDESKLEEAERNLRLLGIFTTIKTTFLQAAEATDLVHVVLQVEERYDDWGTIEVAGGWATDSGWFVTPKYVNSNLFGLGKGLNLGGTYGEFRQEISTTYIDPRLLGFRLRFDLNWFYRVEQTIRLGSIKTIGFSGTFSREVLPKLRLFLRYDYKQVSRKEVLQRPSGASEDISDTKIATPSAGWGAGFDYDRRDSPLMPSRGFRASASGFYAARLLDPFRESTSFAKFNVTTTGYVPLGRSLLVYGGVQYDHGVPLDGASLLPKTERFFAGGDTTVRGIEEDRLKTELIKVPLPPLPFPDYYAYQLIAVGGNIRILGKLELIYPLTHGRIAVQNALFFDTGVITNSLDGLRLEDFRHSIGIAPIRVTTPVGFLSFEYAWPLDPRVGDDPTGRFHFNFGFGF
ncbi:MAG TPA: outer membrane protein assembly factor BamA [Polyangia bacterium]|nr:outer membrane protein assembly factor BamA [Polyangia bacterium]